jgi:glutathionyl-hydroquinone reductase
MTTQPARAKRSTIPPKRIVRLGRWGWTTMWHAMMSRLAPRDRTGAYVRPQSEFRDCISHYADAPYPAAAGRYRLYVGWGCPWAHRALVVRALKGLEEAIALSIVSPSTDGVWIFEEPEERCASLPELYQLAKPGYGGRSTVPVLWDTETHTIVNNESAEIIVMLNAEFNAFAHYPELDLYPLGLKAEIDQWNDRIYDTVNNGVYRCGFAQSQSAYDHAYGELFATLDEIDSILAHQRYLCGDRPTLVDVRLFTTLIRFDSVYYSLFKCNRRRIVDYANLSNYLRDLYQLPGVAVTCNLGAIKRDYYGNLFPLNPGGIIPNGPELNLEIPHGRDRLAPFVNTANPSP